MAWSNDEYDENGKRVKVGQKSTVHKYKRFAALNDQDYRDVLVSVAGVRADGSRSAADPDLTQYHFDQVMARIEAVLQYRIDEGFVDAPRGIKLNYWRGRLPKPGYADSRLVHEIRDWWYKLQPYLPKEKRTREYLYSIAASACGHSVTSIPELRARQCGPVIEALKDRLRWALKTRSPEEAVADFTPVILHDQDEALQQEPSHSVVGDPAPIEDEVPF